MEMLRVKNLLSHAVGISSGRVLRSRAEGDASRPGFLDLPAEEVNEWLTETNQHHVTAGWVEVAPPGGENVVKVAKASAVQEPQTTAAPPPPTTAAPEVASEPATTESAKPEVEAVKEATDTKKSRAKKA